MSIEEATKYLKALKHCETCEADDTNKCKSCPDYRMGSSAKCYDAIDIGVDIMNKFQKIKDIVINGDDVHYKLLMQIKEVIEDEND